MKMAKPSASDIDAAGDLMSILNQVDGGYYPVTDGDGDDMPTFFDEFDRDHLRAFYEAIKETMNRSPGYPGRVIGGMCYVIMYDKNEIIDPASDVIELHPKLVATLECVASSADSAADARDARRYRWLLDHYARGDGYTDIDAALNDGEPEKYLSPAIDAAIASMQPEGE